MARLVEKNLDEKSEKRLYLCTIAALQNADEAGRRFTYLARG